MFLKYRCFWLKHHILLAGDWVPRAESERYKSVIVWSDKTELL
jgi:hypothetical protein